MPPVKAFVDPTSHLPRAHRTVAWSKDGGLGAEFALVDFGADDLRADGYGIGFEPEPYRLEYTLQTTTRFVTSRVAVVTRGDGWVRQLDLYRASSGT